MLIWLGERLAVSGNKKGPQKDPVAHRLSFRMTSAIPGGAPGYDDDKELGNNVAHATRRTSRRLREHSRRSANVKARTTDFAIVQL
ncbi:hypothetical protein [Bradyrhizobium sp.]|uniref:hypothetical protein n=1 Tax=Bradyrhizobium sp. TaxID=376 RepID=UPI0025C321E5|nr:hypothetical protein [Bradyrhizobium sp.]